MKRIFTKIVTLMLTICVAASLVGTPVYAANGSTSVYLTKTGECYHLDGCSCLRKSKIPSTLSDAVARGYRPCSKCGAPTLDATASTNGKTKVGTGQSGTATGYVVDMGTLKFHTPNCSKVKNIKKANRMDVNFSKKDLMANGFVACPNCKP